jgi:hypothetical protein
LRGSDGGRTGGHHDPLEIALTAECLRRCHGIKNLGAFLDDLRDRGHLDGFKGRHGLGSECYNEHAA